MATEAQIRASVKWNRARDNIMLHASKEEGAAIRAAANAAGLSLQGYILRAVRAWMETADPDAVPTEIDATGLDDASDETGLY